MTAERMFPLQQGDPIPWAWAEKAYDFYAQLFGRDQSLARLAERGGFSVQEWACLYLRHDVYEAHVRRDGPGCIQRAFLLAGGADRAELERVRTTINSPMTDDFDRAVPIEAAHQVERWGTAHDAGKEPQDWFWLIGYLSGKCLRAHLDGNTEKALHHTISTAAALRNWHRAIRGANDMRPGIDGEAALSGEA